MAHEHVIKRAIKPFLNTFFCLIFARHSHLAYEFETSKTLQDFSWVILIYNSYTITDQIELCHKKQILTILMSFDFDMKMIANSAIFFSIFMLTHLLLIFAWYCVCCLRPSCLDCWCTNSCTAILFRLPP